MRLFYKRIYLLLLLSVMGAIRTTAQNFQFTEHWNEVQKQKAMYNYPISKWDSLRCAWYGECPVSPPPSQPSTITYCPLAKRMFGWHSIASSATNYQWSLLIELSFNGFDAKLNRTSQNDLAPLLQSFDEYTALRKLRYLCEALSRKQVLGTAYDEAASAVLLKKLEPNTNEH